MSRKHIVSVKFWASSQKICRNCAFPQNIHTGKLGETSAFFASNKIVIQQSVLNSADYLFTISFNIIVDKLLWYVCSTTDTKNLMLFMFFIASKTRPTFEERFSQKKTNLFPLSKIVPSFSPCCMYSVYFAGTDVYPRVKCFNIATGNYIDNSSLFPDRWYQWEHCFLWT